MLGEHRQDLPRERDTRDIVLGGLYANGIEGEQEPVPTDPIDDILVMEKDDAATVGLCLRTRVTPAVLNRKAKALAGQDAASVKVGKGARDSVVHRGLRPARLTSFLLVDEMNGMRAQTAP